MGGVNLGGWNVMYVVYVVERQEGSSASIPGACNDCIKFSFYFVRPVSSIYTYKCRLEVSSNTDIWPIAAV